MNNSRAHINRRSFCALAGGTIVSLALILLVVSVDDTQRAKGQGQRQ